MKIKILISFGTRPEIIKLYPIINELKKNKKFKVKLLNTGQHKELLDPFIKLFRLKINYKFKSLKKKQNLTDLSSKILLNLNSVFTKEKFDFLVVQGDTITTSMSSISAYLNKVKIIHVESGLRSHNMTAPWPEEFNRKLVSIISDFNFVPTMQNKKNLQKENIQKNIYKVGNSIVDSLKLVLKNIEKKKNKEKLYKKFKFLDPKKKLIIITGHRRENFSKNYDEVIKAINSISKDDSLQIIFISHFNPFVRFFQNKIEKNDNIKIINPLNYDEFIFLLSKSYFIISDSGGIQEEAPTLKKPLIVTRDVTERQEAIKNSSAVLATNKKKIVKIVKKLITNKKFYSKFIKKNNPFGKGNTSILINKILSNEVFKKNR